MTSREAIAVANDSRYGLGGAVFAHDPAHGIDVASRIVTVRVSRSVTTRAVNHAAPNVEVVAPGR